MGRRRQNNEALQIFRDDGPIALYRATNGDRRAAALTTMPSHMHNAIALYVVFGIAPGGFLSSFLSNDLMGTIGRADHINRECLPAYVSFFYNDAPSGCFGSHDAFEAWVGQGGMMGLTQEIEA